MNTCSYNGSTNTSDLARQLKTVSKNVCYLLSQGGGGSGTVTSISQSFTGGLISVAGSPITTSGTLALTVAGTSGGIPYFSSSSTWASSSVLAANSLMKGGGAGVAPSTITTGTGVLTALGVNTGSAGAMVLFNGALGTPSSGTVTNLTGTASININGTVGATTPTTGAFTTGNFSGALTLSDNIFMPNTTISVGAIYFNGTMFIQNFNPPNTDGGNVFIGRSGNVTMAWDGVNSYTAARNVAIGESALLNNTTGYFNNVIGFESLKANTTGAGNAVLGSRALLFNTTAHDNAAIGDNSLYSNTTGYESQAVGYKALYNNTTGYHNVAVGYSAGFNLTQGYRNTFLGSEASVDTGIAATVNNSTAVGYAANITASNQIVLGNATVTEVLTLGQISANSVGSNIRMKGDGTTANDGFASASSGGIIYFANFGLTRGWQINADGTMRSISTGAVGIGGASGSNKLDVTGSIGATTTINAAGTINANSVGANMRIKADGTTAKDGGFFAGSGGDIYLANWDANRGILIKSTGELQILSTIINFGGATSSFPRFTRNGTGIDIKLADNSAYTTLATGDIKLSTAGNGLYVKEGTNATMGRAVLVGGTVVVSTTKVTANSEIFLTNNVNGGTLGSLSISARTAGTSFTITSTNILDTSTISWLIVEPS